MYKIRYDCTFITAISEVTEGGRSRSSSASQRPGVPLEMNLKERARQAEIMVSALVGAGSAQQKHAAADRSGPDKELLGRRLRVAA